MNAPSFPKIAIPATLSEDLPYFRFDELEEAVDYYRAEGYVVIRGLISAEACDAAREAFNRIVRPSRKPILRQKNMRYERNAFSDDGFLVNPLFNLQDLNTKTFGGFKTDALAVLTGERVAAVTNALLGGPAKMIQSMFFEAPAGTWAHQDSYYQDSANNFGNVTAGWYALEDIDAGAGRFFVCKRSHKEMAVVRNSGELNMASGHERYKQAIVEAIAAGRCEMVAPYLAKGDAVFWPSFTVHGSLEASRPGVSRTSMTAHYLRQDDELLQFHARVRPQRTVPSNSMALALLHDQDNLKNQIIAGLSFTFPGPIAWLRKTAMAAVIDSPLAKRLRGGRGPQARAAAAQ